MAKNMQVGAKRLVSINAGLKKEETVLIVTDTENINIAQAMVKAVDDLGCDYSLAIMKPRKTHGEDPTAPIANAMLKADVVFAPTKFSLSHSLAREAANAAGVRFISMPDYTEGMLEGGAIEADFLKIYETVTRLKDILTKAKKIHITTPAGTNIVIDVTNRIGNEVSGVCRKPGTWGSPPNIEVNVSPIEDKTQGTIVADGSIPMPEIGVINKPFTMNVVNGKAEPNEETSQAATFFKLLDYKNHPENLVIAEFGIGLNDRAHLNGSMLEDEGTFGTAHFGFGHNFDQGGMNKATKHIDVVYKSPTVNIDGKDVMVNGKLI